MPHAAEKVPPTCPHPQVAVSGIQAEIESKERAGRAAEAKQTSMAKTLLRRIAELEAEREKRAGVERQLKKVKRTHAEEKRKLLAHIGQASAIGTPEQAAKAVRAFVERTGADEIVFGGSMFDPSARCRALELAMDVLTG